MDKLILIAAMLLGNLQVTSYQSLKSQTDDSPYHTSIGDHVCKHGVAVSRDLLDRWGGPLHYGDQVYIEDFGIKTVNDVMADDYCVKYLAKVCVQRKKIRQAIDIWVPDFQSEKAIGVQHKKVYVIKKGIYAKESKQNQK